ncbi:helix-turn-helix domain-containing protein [Candidatus Parcubacteria bacterium]|nr:MAG: helix-turn-helix domain-containing protein [Candidatus Parcubacteria bacterium]
MPWKETCAMDERAEFVLAAREENRNLSALCRNFGISRKTGYKWLKRYEAGGLAGLRDLSPKAPPNPPRYESGCHL